MNVAPRFRQERSHPTERGSSPAARPCAPATLRSHELTARDGFASQDETRVCPQVLLAEASSTAGFCKPFITCHDGSAALQPLNRASRGTKPTATWKRTLPPPLPPKPAAPGPRQTSEVCTTRLSQAAPSPAQSQPGPFPQRAGRVLPTARGDGGVAESAGMPAGKPPPANLTHGSAKGRRGLGTTHALQHRYALRSRRTGRLRIPQQAGSSRLRRRAHTAKPRSEIRNSFRARAKAGRLTLRRAPHAGPAPAAARSQWRSQPWDGDDGGGSPVMHGGLRGAADPPATAFTSQPRLCRADERWLPSREMLGVDSLPLEGQSRGLFVVLERAGCTP